MALFPCTGCGKRTPGRLKYRYLAVLNGSEAERVRHKLCSDCAGQLHEAVCDKLIKIEEGVTEYPTADRCADCGSNAGRLRGVFVTGYGDGDSREDWYGAMDEACFVKVLNWGPSPDLAVASAPRMARIRALPPEAAG